MDGQIGKCKYQMLTIKNIKMKTIKLSNSESVAIVFDCDYDLVSRYTWRLKKSANKSYVCTTIRENGGFRTVRLHRLIMNPTERQDVHHVDRNILNNQRNNLECIDHGFHGYVTRCENKPEPDNIPF